MKSYCKCAPQARVHGYLTQTPYTLTPRGLLLLGAFQDVRLQHREATLPQEVDLEVCSSRRLTEKQTWTCTPKDLWDFHPRVCISENWTYGYVLLAWEKTPEMHCWGRKCSHGTANISTDHILNFLAYLQSSPSNMTMLFLKTLYKVLPRTRVPVITRHPATVALRDPVNLKTLRTAASPLMDSSWRGGSLLESSSCQHGIQIPFIFHYVEQLQSSCAGVIVYNYRTLYSYQRDQTKRLLVEMMWHSQSKVSGAFLLLM